jgi:hypothetical protein
MSSSKRRRITAALGVIAILAGLAWLGVFVVRRARTQPWPSNGFDASVDRQTGNGSQSGRSSGHPTSEQVDHESIASEERSTTLVAKTIEGDVLADVVVSRRRGMLTEVLGRTDGRGAIAVSQRLGDEFGATLPGFEPASLLVERTDQEPSIVLHRKGIAGRVVFGQAEAPPTPVRVVALEVAESLDGAAIVTARMKEPNPRGLVVADAAGNFSIPDLFPERKYLIYAGAKGYVQEASSLECRAGADALIVKMVRAFGVRACLVEGEAEAPRPFDRSRFSPGAVQYEVGTWTNGVAPYWAGSPSLVLGESSSEQLHDNASCMCYILAGDVALQQVDGYFTMTVPGYSICKESLTAQWLALGAMDISIRLVATGTDFGDLRLRFTTRSTGSAYVPAEVCAGVLVLRREDGQVVNFGIRDQDDHSTTLTGIPVGRYSWTFSARNSEWRWPEKDAEPEYVAMTTNGADVEVRTPVTGSVEFAIVQSNGEQYVGPARLTFGVGRPTPLTPQERLEHPERSATAMRVRHVSAVSFEKAPYVLKHIKPGEYFPRLRSPFDATLSAASVVVDVKPLETTLATFVEAR